MSVARQQRKKDVIRSRGFMVGLSIVNVAGVRADAALPVCFGSRLSVGFRMVPGSVRREDSKSHVRQCLCSSVYLRQHVVLWCE